MILNHSHLFKESAMTQLYKVSFIVMFACFFTGCTSIPSTMITSTSPLPPGVRGTIKTSASDCQYSLLGFIPVTSSPSSANALEDAKRYADVDVLTDVTQDFSAGYYILWSNSCVRITGFGVPREVLKNFSANQN